jgi:hypothetical protein
MEITAESLIDWLLAIWAIYLARFHLFKKRRAGVFSAPQPNNALHRTGLASLGAGERRR